MERPVGVKAPYPGFIPPALATAAERVPWRTVDLRNQVRRLPRPGASAGGRCEGLYPLRLDWTNRFQKIASDAWHISAGSAIIDGEVVVPAENGPTDFSVLQNELKGRSSKVVLVAFDLLYPNGRDLRAEPLFERKAALKKTISGTGVQFSESFEVDPKCSSTPVRPAWKVWF
jgi:bifunctional non-homologous end joining protein LigD